MNAGQRLGAAGRAIFPFAALAVPLALIVLAAIGIVFYLVADRLLRRAVSWHAESNPAED